MTGWTNNPPTSGTNPPQTETEFLNLRRLAINVGIGGQLLEDLQLTARIDERFALHSTAKGMLLTLHTHAWSENLPPATAEAHETFTIEAPASWWQHLKETHARTWWLGWLARRRPPVMNTVRKVEGHLVVNLERYRLYPDAPPLAHRNGRPVQQHVLDNNAWWTDLDPHA